MIPLPVIQVWDETGSSPIGEVTAVSKLVVSDVLSDVGSLQLEAPADVAGVDLLMVDADRQVRVKLPGVDPFWFVLDDDSWTDISDDPASESRSFVLRSLASVLDEVKLQADVSFSSANPGQIIASVFSTAQGRGFLQGLTLAGDASADAAGDSWPEAVTQSFKRGDSPLSVLAALTDGQWVEWRLRDRTLEVYRPSGGLDRTLDVVLRPGVDVESAPITRSRRSVVTDVLVEGGSGTTHRSQTLTGRRKREAFLAQSGAGSSSLDQIGDAYLAAHAASDVQYSHGLADGDVWPWRDYRPGDRIGSIAASTSVDRRRVMQIALEYGVDDTKVSLELNSILKSAEERFAKTLAKLAPGQN